ncbi:TraC family protein, partial [Cysteiniphilum litorale]|uniref:TraC family protein n=2 Tax=Cysteiniphilum litorale TaxID=2056700 RepID=UPI003F883FF1
DRKSKNGKHGFGFGLQLAPLTGASLNLVKDLNDLIVSKLPAGKKFSYQFSLLGHRQLLEKIQYNAHVHSKRGGMYADIANNQANLAIKALIDGFPSGYGKHARFDLKEYEAYFFAHCIGQDADKMANIKEDVEIALSTAQIYYQAMDAEALMAHVGHLINHNPKKLKPSEYHHNPYAYLNQQVVDVSTVIDEITANYIDISFKDETCGYGDYGGHHAVSQDDDTVQAEENVEKAEEKAEVRVVCLSLKKLPSDFFMTQLPEFLSSSNNIGLSLRCPFLWTTNFQIEDKLSSDTQTRKKIKSLDKLRSLGFEKLLPFLNDELSEYRDIQRGLEDDRYRICTFSMDLILFSTKADYKKDVAAAMNLFRHGLQLQSCQYLQGQIFQSIFPFCYASLSQDRQRSGTRHRSKSPNVASFLPIVGDYKGAYDPDKGEHQGRSYGLITTTAKNQFAPLNLFKMGTDSYNVVIAGAKGSGKSVLAQLLIYQIVAMGGYAWAIDKGNSFRDLVEMVEGRHINAMELYLNPFSYLDLEKMENDPDLMNDPDIDVYSVYSNTISMIAELFYMIGKPKDKEVCPWQFAKLTQAVMLAHQQFTTDTKVDHVWDELKKMVDEQRRQNNGHCDTRLSDWLDLLKIYRTDSYSKTHSKIFNETSKLDPDSPFICVEVEGVSKEMINPLMMALSIDINNRIILSRDAKPKGFFIEEAPQIMRFESQTLQDKFSEAAATYRKKHAALAFIGQTV